MGQLGISSKSLIYTFKEICQVHQVRQVQVAQVQVQTQVQVAQVQVAQVALVRVQARKDSLPAELILCRDYPKGDR